MQHVLAGMQERGEAILGEWGVPKDFCHRNVQAFLGLKNIASVGTAEDIADMRRGGGTTGFTLGGGGPTRVGGWVLNSPAPKVVLSLVGAKEEFLP